ncbi:hypothetical protein K0A96_01615, partial [Patescibacteria group bacterium]|nr:hypothetical protein [Patescibacteria group bacterium]
VFWGVVVGTTVSLVFPETKKYLLGTVIFGVLGSVFGGILYGFFKISEAIYTNQNTLFFGIFLLFAFLLTGLVERTKF